MSNIINVHVGQFGVNMAKCLYAEESSLKQKNSLVVDVDNDCLDEFVCSSQKFEGRVVYNQTKGYGNGEYFHSRLCNRQDAILEDTLSKIAEPMDSVRGLVYYSSLSGGVGSYGLESIRQSLGSTVPIIAAQLYPD